MCQPDGAGERLERVHYMRSLSNALAREVSDTRSRVRESSRVRHRVREMSDARR